MQQVMSRWLKLIIDDCGWGRLLDGAADVSGKRMPIQSRVVTTGSVTRLFRASQERTLGGAWIGRQLEIRMRVPHSYVFVHDVHRELGGMGRPGGFLSYAPSERKPRSY
jgi:hypothetical protein